MEVVMREMSEIRTLGPYRLRGPNCLGNAQVGGVTGTEKSVDHQNAHAAQCIDDIVRDRLRVSHVGEAADPIREDGHRSVWNRYRKHSQPGNLRWLPVAKGYRATFGLRCSGKRSDVVVEDVWKSLREPRQRVSRTVHLQRRVTAVRQRTDIVQPMSVIGVIVCVEHR